MFRVNTSSSVRLVEYVIEAGAVDRAHAVALVSAGDHLSQFLVGHVLAQLSGDLFEFIEGDRAVFVEIEELKGLVELLLRVLLTHLGDHDVEKLMKVDAARVIFVEVADQVLQLLLRWFKTERAECHLEFLGLDGAGAGGVEQVEGLLDFLLLRLAQLLLVGILLLLVHILLATLALISTLLGVLVCFRGLYTTFLSCVILLTIL